MIRITRQDFDKFVKLLTKDGQDGCYLSFKEDHPFLQIRTMDRSNKELIVELSDVECPYMPRKTTTETF